MAHENVAVEVEVGAAAEVGLTHHLVRQLQHRGAVLHEVEVGSADAARPHLDEHLAEAGSGLLDVVAHDHVARPQHRRLHDPPPFVAAVVSSTWVVMASRMACPARPKRCSRFEMAHWCDASVEAS